MKINPGAPGDSGKTSLIILLGIHYDDRNVAQAL
jgi:hypothetical protein